MKFPSSSTRGCWGIRLLSANGESPRSSTPLRKWAAMGEHIRGAAEHDPFLRRASRDAEYSKWGTCDAPSNRIGMATGV